MRYDLPSSRLLEIQIKNVMMGRKHTGFVNILLGGLGIKF